MNQGGQNKLSTNTKLDIKATFRYLFFPNIRTLRDLKELSPDISSIWLS